jgi:hypothetical protein
MMRIDPKPEPADFNKQVRQPGKRFLARYPNPTTKQFDSHSYWRKMAQQLHKCYDGICAYSCHWIPYDTGADTIEHFQPKSLHPTLAYEWSNYRLVCGTLNGRRGTEDVLDPFTIQNGWFILEFPSLFIKAAPGLAPDLTAQIISTRDRLGLNDEGTCLKSRQRYVIDYCNKDISFNHLTRDAPFIAQQLVCHRLEDVETLRQVMGYL